MLEIKKILGMNNIFDKLNKDLRQEFMKVMTSQ